MEGMNDKAIEQAYAIAKERYAAIGVDTDAVIDLLQKQQISLHCWQTDDVVGFERNEALSGGIQTTGNYPGRARNIDEVRQDIAFVKTLLAGNHRLNLHEIYGDFGGQFVDRDQIRKFRKRHPAGIGNHLFLNQRNGSIGTAEGKEADLKEI